MAYINELAKNQGNQSLMANSGLKEFLKEIEFVSSVNEYIRLDDYVTSDFVKAKNSNLKHIFVIDGSKFETKLGENEEIHISLLNVNQCIINVPKMVKYLANSFALPKEYQEIKKDITLNLIIPLKGLKGKDIVDEKDFFRMYFYKIMSHTNNRIIDWLEEQGFNINEHETLLETYIHLISNLTKLNTNINSPCPECRKLGHSLGLKTFKNKDETFNHTVSCKCQTATKTYYITDLLQFYEQLNNENSNEALTTQMMLVLERITMLNLLRNLEKNDLQEIIEQSAFVLDGSLAIYSHASWLSSAILEEIIKIKNKYQTLIIGVEKTGNFVEHFKKVDNFFKKEPLKNGALFFLNDYYIKKYIKMYDNDSFYGEKNYFGKKLLYKNRLGKLFVINVAFEDEADKFLNYNERNTETERNKCQRMEDLIMLLENFSSQAYPNALSFISMANDGASLSSSTMGKKLLNDFVVDILELKRTNELK